VIEALLEALALKALPRAGWVRAGVPDPESVAAHTWGVSTLVLLLLPPGLDRERALTYATLHDVAEAWVGDITPHDGVSPDDKAARERGAMRAWCARLPNGAELLARWEAYEAQGDDEARFVRQLDRLDMALQALVYERGGHGRLDDFFASAERGISRPELVGALAAIRAARS
jgi:putative hydrolases of HD superfamily